VEPSPGTAIKYRGQDYCGGKQQIPWRVDAREGGERKSGQREGEASLEPQRVPQPDLRGDEQSLDRRMCTRCAEMIEGQPRQHWAYRDDGSRYHERRDEIPSEVSRDPS
jgi:hypothetical protein